MVFPLATTLAKGAYLAVSEDFSIIESGCALEVDIGGELRVWYFTGETDVLGGYLSGSASGEVACIMSVRGKLSVEVERLLEGEGARVSGFVLMMATTITSAPVPPSLGSLVRCWAWMVRAQDLEELGARWWSDSGCYTFGVQIELNYIDHSPADGDNWVYKTEVDWE